MPGPPPRNPKQPFGPPARGFNVGSSGGKDGPVAPKAQAGWNHLCHVIATGMPTATRQAAYYRRAALRALK